MNPHYCLRDTNVLNFHFLIPCTKMTRKIMLLLNYSKSSLLLCITGLVVFLGFFFPLLVIRGWGIQYIALGKSGVSNMLLLHS